MIVASSLYQSYGECLLAVALCRQAMAARRASVRHRPDAPFGSNRAVDRSAL